MNTFEDNGKWTAIVSKTRGKITYLRCGHGATEAEAIANIPKPPVPTMFWLSGLASAAFGGAALSAGFLAGTISLDIAKWGTAAMWLVATACWFALYLKHGDD